MILPDVIYAWEQIGKSWSKDDLAIKTFNSTKYIRADLVETQKEIPGDFQDDLLELETVNFELGFNDGSKIGNRESKISHREYLRSKVRQALTRANKSEWNFDIDEAPKGELIDVIWGDKRFIDCYWDHICQEWRHMTHYNKLVFIKKPDAWKYLDKLPTPPNASEE